MANNNIELHDVTDELKAIDISVTPVELIQEIYHLRRWTRFGVYTSQGLLFFVSYYILGLNTLQLVVLQAMLWTICIVSVEASFVHGFRLGKHDTYPGAVVMEVGKTDHLTDAVRSSLKVVQDLLGVHSSFLVLHQGSTDPNGADTMGVFFSGMSQTTIKRLLQASASTIEEAMRTRRPLPFKPDGAALPKEILGGEEQLVFIPVLALQEPIGVFAVLGKKSNVDIRDRKLLYDLGTALGLSLQNFRQKEALQQQKEELHTMAITDDLSKTYNRRYFFDQLVRELAAAQRYESPLSVIMFDLDNFKKINDTHGHAVGDEVIHAIAQRLVRYSRSADIVARLGGDELVVILPRTNKRDALDISQRLQQAVTKEPLSLPDGDYIPLGISGGCGTYPDDASDIENLLRKADAAMYSNKTARKALRPEDKALSR